MKNWDSQRFLREGKSAAGIDPAGLQNAVATAKALHDKSPGLPPVFSLNHLAYECDVPFTFLRGVVERAQSDTYRIFKLKKNSAGFLDDRFRWICAPHPQLLKAQRWINKNILSELPVSSASFAYRADGGILRAAELHSNCNWLIKLDITNFFESILEPDVYKIFLDTGYQPLIAFELARLCTRLRERGNPIQQDRTFDEKLPYLRGAIGHLPQGAATSPLLANLASRRLDDALLNFAQDNELTYSRYADDLVFSSQNQFCRATASAYVKACYNIIREHGLWPNKIKTRVVPPGARKVVLGLLVDGDKPRLTKEFKQLVRTHTYFLLNPNIGPIIHAKNRGFDSIYGMQRHIYGLVAYAYGIEPVWAKEKFLALGQVDWPSFEGF
jgi:RNA-directed DNA polymerase